MKTPKWIGLIAAAVLLSGCQIIGPDDERTEETSNQREIWEAYSDGTYSFVLARGCFCAYGGSYWVQVVDGEVTLALDVYQNQSVPEEGLNIIESIDDIFDMIERAEREADDLEVEYAEEGYPTRVVIDWIKQAVDDEMYLEVSEVILGVQRVD